MNFHARLSRTLVSLSRHREFFCPSPFSNSYIATPHSNSGEEWACFPRQSRAVDSSIISNSLPPCLPSTFSYSSDASLQHEDSVLHREPEALGEPEVGLGNDFVLLQRWI